jgi:hypothetical protein
MGCFDKILYVLEELHKANGKDEKIARSLFSAYLGSNSFFKMSGIAMKMQVQFQQ